MQAYTTLFTIYKGKTKGENRGKFLSNVASGYQFCNNVVVGCLSVKVTSPTLSSFALLPSDRKLQN